MACVEQHGRQGAMERIDNITARLWKGPGIKQKLQVFCFFALFSF
jgi:hypothetical protein